MLIVAFKVQIKDSKEALLISILVLLQTAVRSAVAISSRQSRSSPGGTVICSGVGGRLDLRLLGTIALSMVPR
ncbi:hypothetical protein BMJ22_34635 [Sinorhizobium medicae]|nr:hypothetical protein BMJ22_34635 [Sinorhizobium medicae]